MRIAFRLSSVRASRALTSFVAPALVASAFLVGCGDGNGTSDGTGGSGAGGGSSSGGNTVKLTQANNFTAMSTLTISSATAPAGQDFSICWDQLTTDIQGHTVTPATDINQVTFVPALGTTDQVEGWLNTGQLGNSKISGGGAYIFTPTGSSNCAMLSQFHTVVDETVKYKPSDFKAQDGISYLVVFNTGTQLGAGARTMLFLTPSTSETNGTIKATNTSTTLAYHADLHDLVKPTFDATKPPIMDWNAVTQDGQGVSIDKNSVTRILVGFYKGKVVSDLEAGFLNLDQKTEAAGGPTVSWELKISKGQTANLAAAVGRNGEAALTSFAMTDQGTWLFGGFCEGCQNPAPVIVTILDPK